ncbi:serine threonine kinase [Fusarium agapanthi]|uniref:Serine threonine kinase n=1 Tax=Fusarium agapanthi TaxID=1803897 RepID=A0A9P5B2E2_9HYPO|nr:serine threonine kinase [Fusarium agapanthi]
MALYRQLDKCLIHCHDDSEFLPLNEISARVTEANIKLEIPFRKRCFSNRDLPRTILSQARSVFSILVLIQETQAIVDLVCRDNIRDEDLPLTRQSASGDDENVLISSKTGKTFCSFSFWPREARVRDFLNFQWLNDPEPYVAVKEVANDEAFETEKANLELTQSLQHEHLITLIATCQKGPICYFIFPWAGGGDLKDFWKANDGQSRSQELVLWSLRQMLGIVSAINALHGKITRHGDIKPQNILHFLKSHDDSTMENRGRLILADVGVSKIHREITSMRQDPTNCQQSTVTYEAPEAQSDQREGKPRGRRYDMWSLGCMFLEFTVWLVFDYSTVRSFRKSRRTRDDPKDAFGSFFLQASDNLIQIHSAVIEAIGHLRSQPLCSSNTALADLIQLIEDDLLQVDVQKRVEAPELLEKLERVTCKAEQSSDYLYPILDGKAD